MNEDLRITVGIGDPSTTSDPEEVVFESADPTGILVVPVEGLMKVLRDSSSGWRKKDLLIQAHGTCESDTPDTLFAADNRIELSKQSRSITVDEHPVDNLTACEFDLLEFLMSNPDKVSERSEIFWAVWRHSFSRGDRSVDVYVNKLRKKIGTVSQELGDRENGAIRTRFGIGYYAVSSLTSS